MVGWLAQLIALRAHFEAQVGSLGAHVGPKLGPKRLLGGGLGVLGPSWAHHGPKTAFRTPPGKIGPRDLGPLGTQIGAMLGPRWLPRGVEI